MNDDIKRYNPMIINQMPDMEYNKNGHFVLYDDIKHLLSKHKETQQEASCSRCNDTGEVVQGSSDVVGCPLCKSQQEQPKESLTEQFENETGYKNNFADPDGVIDDKVVAIEYYQENIEWLESKVNQLMPKEQHTDKGDYDCSICQTRCSFSGDKRISVDCTEFEPKEQPQELDIKQVFNEWEKSENPFYPNEMKYRRETFYEFFEYLKSLNAGSE